MAPKHLFLLLLALFATSVAQTDDELPIPEENDNQFPPDNHSEPGPTETANTENGNLSSLHPELDAILEEGSGAGIIDEPLQETTKSTDSSVPLLEDVQLTSVLVENDTLSKDGDYICPVPCVCNVEGDTDHYVVDCSGSDLLELPSPLDSKTTQLNLQNNKLTKIPKEISALKGLKILNANNNEIMDIVAGSVSELSELTSLKLGNNRLIEYPTDLKNSFGLMKLEELDLGGNDMRTPLNKETFSNFVALKKLVLPSAAAGIVEDVCASLKESLQTVCTGSCTDKSFDCPDAPHSFDDDLLDFALPGLIALETLPSEDEDPSVSNPTNGKAAAEQVNSQTPTETASAGDTLATNSATSFRAAIDKTAGEEQKLPETEPHPSEAEAASNSTQKTKEVVGATTSTAKTGGVDRSVIIIVVGGMVLIVAGITIKKNWSSIRNRFSSSPRAANNVRTDVSANGTTPEEVPLQEKSPV